MMSGLVQVAVLCFVCKTNPRHVTPSGKTESYCRECGFGLQRARWKVRRMVFGAARCREFCPTTEYRHLLSPRALERLLDKEEKDLEVIE